MTPQQKQKFKRILSIAGIVANSLLAMLTIFSAFGGIINPAKTAVGALMAMTFPIFLVLTLIALVINLIWFRRNAIINGLSLLICISPILTYCPLNFFRPSVADIEHSDEKTIKIMSYNVYSFFDLTGYYPESGSLTLQYILDEDADIVLCQEAGTIFYNKPKGITDEQMSKLVEQYPYHEVVDYNMAIFSKYPFENHMIDHPSSDHLALRRYDVNVSGKMIHIFNIHMQSIGLTDDDKRAYMEMTELDTSDHESDIRHDILAKLAAAFRSRASQAETVRKALDEVEGTVLLCGDFNDIPGCYASRTIQGNDMTDAYRHAGLGPAITYHANRFYFRIDQMYYRGEIDALRVDCGDCPSSDHYPLIAYFKLKH